MLKGFKDFLLRGNVLDLAVAVVIGAAFTAIVTCLHPAISSTHLSLRLAEPTEYGWGIQLTGDSAETFLNFGAVVTAIINFIIIAAVVYFVLIVPCECGEEEVRLRSPRTRKPAKPICSSRSATSSRPMPVAPTRERTPSLSNRQCPQIKSGPRTIGPGALIYFSTAVVRGAADCGSQSSSEDREDPSGPRSSDVVSGKTSPKMRARRFLSTDGFFGVSGCSDKLSQPSRLDSSAIT